MRLEGPGTTRLEANRNLEAGVDHEAGEDLGPKSRLEGTMRQEAAWTTRLEGT